MEKVLVEEVAPGTGAPALPERVQVALGDLAGQARRGCWP